MKNHINNLLNKLKEHHIYIKLNDEENIEVAADKGKIPAEMINEIKENKEEIILYLKSLKKESRTKIEKAQQSDNYAVSSAQRRLWIVCQNEEASISFNMPASKILEGVKNKLYLLKAIDSVIDRHEILRTVFNENENGELKQYILDRNTLNFKIDYKDFRNETNIQSAVADYIKEDSFKPFDLINGPLLRASLLQTAEEEYCFYYNMHHIISDEWSLGILEKEVLAYYESYLTDTIVNLPELQIQYKDYSVWEDALLASDEMKGHKEFWKENLSGDLAALNLPSNKKRPKFRTYNGCHFQTNIAPESIKNLKHIIQKEEGSVFMGLLSVLKILLYKYTNEKNIILGFPMAGREDYELENQIGFYIKTLVLKNHLSPEDSFVKFFKEVKKNTLAAFKHQDYPFDELVSDLNLNHDPGRTPVYDMSFTFHDSSSNNYAETQYNVIKTLGTGKCKHDIEFHFQEINDYVSFSMNFNTDIYEPEMIKRFMTHYSSILSQISNNPEIPVKDISFLSEEEKQQLLHEFNSYKADYSMHKTAVELFDRQVKNAPDNIAVTFTDKKLTYKELDTLSNSLAQTLQNKFNIKKNDFIGVHLTKSELSIVSILGILKAGGVYVPIDTELPSNRKLYIAQDADLKLLITETAFIFDLDFYQGDIFSIDVELDTNPEENIYQDVNLLPADLAYVIYTSGSTGNPKGVMIKHSGLINTAVSQIELFKPYNCSNWLQYSSHSFDASIYEIFISLLGGHSLFILNEETRKDVKLFESYVVENNIDISILPPAFFKMLDVQSLKGFKVLITGGESAVYDKVAEFVQHGNFFNAYGPTEVCVLGTISKIEKGSELLSKTVPIGKPIANTEVYILDEYLNLLPEGAIGEIYITGAGLARGYLNRPELTAEKFIPNPYKEGEIMYKTGDLGKWLADGNIEYTGRIDEQVKIRGYRIELEEIEKHLSLQDEVKHAVVVVKENQDDKYLVAYYVSDVELDKRKLQAALGKILPEYMIPGYFVQVESILMNTSGKVDRKSLPDVVESDLIKEEYIAPRTSEEKLLAAAWSEVLKYEKIGVKDSFFNLGGDSIKSIMLISRLKQQGYVIKVEQILRQPVLEDLAKLVEINTIAVDQKEVAGEVELTPIQYYFFETETIPNKNHYNQSVLLKSKEELEPSVLERSIASLVKHHDALRMVYKQTNTSWEQSNEDALNAHYKISFYDLRDESDQLAALNKLGNELQASFDISSGVLVHVGHFRMSDGDRLALIIHHLVVDGVSWRILLEDLSSLYGSYQSDNEVKLPAKTDSFQRWASLQKDFAKSTEMQSERIYWEEMSEELIPLLPSDYEPSAKTLKIDKRNVFALDNAITEKLQTQVHDVYNTEINDILLTGLGLAVQEVFGISKSVVKMEGHGREEIIEGVDIGRTVGWFTSVYPFVLDVQDKTNQVTAVKESLRKIPNKGIGYGILHYLDKPFSNELIPSIQFNYLGDFGANAGKTDNKVMFEFSSEGIGSSIDIRNSESSILLDISGMMVAGGLSLSIGYSSERYSAQTIQKLSDSYQNKLENLIETLALKSVEKKHTVTDTEKKSGWFYGDLVELSPNQIRFYKSQYACVTIKETMPDFDRNSFEKNFREFLLGIPALSMKLEKIDNKVFQRYIHPDDVEMEILIQDVSFAEQEEILKIEDKFLGRPYDLENEALIRCLVLQQEAHTNDAGITLKIHHSLLDQYSVDKIYQELCSYFQGNGRLNNYNHPFDFIIKKREFLSSDEGVKEREYWKETLQKAPLHFNDSKNKKESVNIIQEVTITSDRFDGIKKAAKQNNLPISAFFIGFYEMILNTLNIENKGLYSFLVNGREQEIQGMDLNQILGVTDNALPISYHGDHQTMSLEFILETYIKYLQNRTYQRIPYETIRQDVMEISGYDIDHNVIGYLNLFVREGSLNSKREINENGKIYSEKFLDFYGVNLECEIFEDGIFLKLISAQNIYQEKQDVISLDNFLQDLYEGIEINQNSEINTF
jgi:amino acid adenylation domain-containing protein/non-ribosomal peptide synthase protein (TIGR01720 family)